MREFKTKQEKIDSANEILRQFHIDDSHQRIGMVWLFGLFIALVMTVGMILDKFNAGFFIKGIVVFIFIMIPPIFCFKKHLLQRVGSKIAKYLSSNLKLAFISLIILVSGLVLITIFICMLLVAQDMNAVGAV